MVLILLPQMIAYCNAAYRRLHKETLVETQSRRKVKNKFSVKTLLIRACVYRFILRQKLNFCLETSIRKYMQTHMNPYMVLDANANADAISICIMVFEAFALVN
jgi:hypothetical protein